MARTLSRSLAASKSPDMGSAFMVLSLSIRLIGMIGTEVRILFGGVSDPVKFAHRDVASRIITESNGHAPAHVADFWIVLFKPWHAALFARRTPPGVDVRYAILARLAHTIKAAHFNLAANASSELLMIESRILRTGSGPYAKETAHLGQHPISDS